MTLEVIRSFFAWCSVINLGLLIIWFLLLVFAGGVVRRLHGAWFKLSDESFHKIHYSGLLAFKIAVFLFNLVPYFALRIIG